MLTSGAVRLLGARFGFVPQLVSQAGVAVPAPAVEVTVGLAVPLGTAVALGPGLALPPHAATAAAAATALSATRTLMGPPPGGIGLVGQATRGRRPDSVG
jgi:hypothetical protein